MDYLVNFQPAPTDSYRATRVSSPKLLKYRTGKANASAGIFDSRQGPCADFLVLHASRTSSYAAFAQFPVADSSLLLPDMQRNLRRIHLPMSHKELITSACFPTKQGYSQLCDDVGKTVALRTTGQLLDTLLQLVDSFICHFELRAGSADRKKTRFMSPAAKSGVATVKQKSRHFLLSECM